MKSKKKKPMGTRNNSKKVVKKSKLLGRFSRWQVIAFVVVFAAIGSFLVLRSLAATSPPGTRCGPKYCYTPYPVDAKVAFWQNGLRKTFNAQPNYVAMNDCLSAYAEYWADRMANKVGLVHSANINPATGKPYDPNYGASMSNCGNWKVVSQNTWKGPCGNTNIDSIANDCGWKIVDAPNPDGKSFSWLHDCYPEPCYNDHLPNIIQAGLSAQGVGSFYDKNGDMWVVGQYAIWQ